MAADAHGTRSGFPVLRFMAALRAARDFGLDPAAADAISLRYDPIRPDADEVVGAFASALLAQRALTLPDALGAGRPRG